MRKIAVEVTIGNTTSNTMIEMLIEGTTIDQKIEDITLGDIKTEMMIGTTAQDSWTKTMKKDTTHRTNMKKIQPTDHHPDHYHPKDQLPLTEHNKNLIDLPIKIRDRPPHPDSTIIFPTTIILGEGCSKIMPINSDIFSFWFVIVGKVNFGVF